MNASAPADCNTFIARFTCIDRRASTLWPTAPFLPLAQHVAERVQLVRPVLLEANCRLSVGQLVLRHRDRALGFSLGQKSDGEYAAVGEAKSNRFGCGGSADFDIGIVQPAITDALVCPRVVQSSHRNIECAGLGRFIAAVATLPTGAQSLDALVP